MGRIIDKITEKFKEELGLGEDDTEVLNYSLTVYSTTVIGYGVIILAALPFGVVDTALASVITSSMLRIFSGGAHASVSRNCILGGGVIFTFLGLFAKLFVPTSSIMLWLTIFGAAGFAFWSVYRYAPADTPGKPITTKKAKDKLRKYSFMVLVGWVAAIFLCLMGFVNVSANLLYASTLGIIWQGFTLTHSGYRLVDSVDRLWPK